MRQLFTSGGQSIGALASIILFSYLLVIVTICVQVSVWMPIFSPLGWLSRNGSTGSYDPPTTYGPQFYDSLISHFLTLWWCRGDGPCCPRDSQESYPAPQFESINPYFRIRSPVDIQFGCSHTFRIKHCYNEYPLLTQATQVAQW